MTNRYPTGEIDLAQLLVATVRVIQKNLWPIVACVVVCTAVALGLFYLRPLRQTFESSMLVYTNRAGESYASRAAFGFSRLRAASTEVRARRLHIDVETASKVVDVQFATQVGSPQGDTKIEEQFFVLTAITSDTAVFPVLQAALLEYLHDNAFIRQREDQRRKGFEEMLTRVNADIARLDSIKVLMATGRLKLPTGTTLIDPTDPYTSSIALYQKRADLMYELGRAKSIQLVEGFSPALRQEGRSLKRYLLAGIVVGILLSVCVIFFRYARDLMRRSDLTQPSS